MGLAPAALPAGEPGGAPAFQDWIDAERQGTMAYMAKRPERRRSITHWFPPARSVVVLAFGYDPGDDPSANAPTNGTGRISRYARSRDYHEVIRRRLDLLLAEVAAAVPGCQGKAFVDTSAVLERLYGRYAGLGWVGKNTMLLSHRIGSYFFLAGLAIDRELIYDEPVPDHCGTCNRCLTACPTDAFPAPRVLDASKCIAYLTIEHRGAIPGELRPGTGDWVFGCDVCQEVCPWNRFSIKGRAFEPEFPDRLPLDELAALSDEEFERRFAHTPVERAGRQGLRRNALLAMGNSEAKERGGDWARLLEEAAADPDPIVAEQARWSLDHVRRAA